MFRKITSLIVVVAFSLLSVVPPGAAQAVLALQLPVPGAMVGPSTAYVPVLLKGMTLHPENPFRFDFIVDNGNSAAQGTKLEAESERLVKYFMAAMTVPQDDLWVNLSPNEPNRIITDDLARTELGRDLLAQDYILKQLTASLMYPEGALGKEFWERVHAAAGVESIRNLTADLFHKVWILPESATVYEHNNTVYIVGSKLKVMLEEDYVSLRGTALEPARVPNEAIPDQIAARPVVTRNDNDVNTELMRDIILPAIEKEVNEGANFAPLRQIYHSLILAKWYKQTVKDSLLSQVYIDRNKVAGTEYHNTVIPENNSVTPGNNFVIPAEAGIREPMDPLRQGDDIEKIYNRYMDAYKQGVYSYMKEDYDAASQTIIPRKYFSGGFQDQAMLLERADAFNPDRAVIGDLAALSIDMQPRGGDGALLPQSEIEQKVAALVAKYQLRLSPYDTAFLKALYSKYINRDRQTKLVIGKNFIPLAFKNSRVDKTQLGIIDYRTIAEDPDNQKPNHDVVLRFHPMNGGLGTSYVRSRAIARVTKGERTSLGAKSQDSFFENISVDGFDSDGNSVTVTTTVSVAELKYLQYIDLARQNVFGDIIIQELVNPESEGPMKDFLASAYLWDRVDGRIKKPRTYAEVINETVGIRLAPGMIVQQALPVIDDNAKDFIDSTDSEAYAPGGHGHIGTYKLMTIADQAPVEGDGKVVIAAIFNGDGTNNLPTQKLVNWMARKSIPIVMVTTTRAPLDAKGGFIGQEIVSGPQYREGIHPAQILEKAQADAVGQADLFQAVGITEGEKNQLFNTNVSLQNETALHPFLNELRQIMLEEKEAGRINVSFEDIITPDLITNPKTKTIDGVERKIFQLEGAKASVLLNLNKFVTTTNNPRVRALMEKYGWERVVHFVNFSPEDRNFIFTPEKYAWDHWLYEHSGLFRVDFTTGRLERVAGAAKTEIHLPGFDLEDVKYYRDIDNVYDAFGKGENAVRLGELDELRITKGRVHFPGVVLKGAVEIHSDYDGIVDLTKRPEMSGWKDPGSGRLVLENVVVKINVAGEIAVEAVTASTHEADQAMLVLSQKESDLLREPDEAEGSISKRAFDAARVRRQVEQIENRLLRQSDLLTKEEKTIVDGIEEGAWLAGPGLYESEQDTERRIEETRPVRERYQKAIDKIQTEIKRKTAEILERIPLDKKKNFKGEEVHVLDGTGPEAKVIGRIDRNIAEQVGYAHETANVVFLSPDGKVVVQLRNKNNYDNHLAVYGGHLAVAEAHPKSANDESNQEAGFSVDHEFTIPRIFIGQESYDEPSDKNRERRSWFIQPLTQEEWEAMQKYKTRDERELGADREKDTWTGFRQKLARLWPKGRGEVTLVKELSYLEIEGLPQAENNESKLPEKMNRFLNLKQLARESGFNAQDIAEDAKAFFTPDSFDRLVKNPLLWEKVKTIILVDFHHMLAGTGTYPLNYQSPAQARLARDYKEIREMNEKIKKQAMAASEDSITTYLKTAYPSYDQFDQWLRQTASEGALNLRYTRHDSTVLENLSGIQIYSRFGTPMTETEYWHEGDVQEIVTFVVHLEAGKRIAVVFDAAMLSVTPQEATSYAAEVWQRFTQFDQEARTQFDPQQTPASVVAEAISRNNGNGESYFHHIQVSGHEHIRAVYGETQRIVRDAVGKDTEALHMNLDEIHVTIANDDVDAPDKLSLTLDELAGALRQDIQGVGPFTIELVGPHLMKNGAVVMEYTTSAPALLHLRKKAEARRAQRSLSESNRAFVPNIIHSTVSVVRDPAIPQEVLGELHRKLSEYRQGLKAIPVEVTAITATRLNESDRRFIESRSVAFDSAMLTELADIIPIVAGMGMDYQPDMTMVNALLANGQVMPVFANVGDYVQWGLAAVVAIFAWKILSKKIFRIKQMGFSEQDHIRRFLSLNNKDQERVIQKLVLDVSSGGQHIIDQQARRVSADLLVIIGIDDDRVGQAIRRQIERPTVSIERKRMLLDILSEIDRVRVSPERQVVRRMKEQLRRDNAMMSTVLEDDSAQLSSEVGGIDMNKINVDRQGTGVKIRFDPAVIDPLIREQIEGLNQADIQGFTPVIINFQPLPSILPLLGLEPARREDEIVLGKS
jgi:hypothetical protein